MNHRLASRAALVFAAAALSGPVAFAQRIPLPRFGAAAQATPFDLAIARGDQALGRGEFAAAQTQFEQARTLNAQDARPHFYLGEVLLRQGQLAQSEPLFRAAVAHNPRMAEAHAELASVLHGLGRDPEALTEAQQALALDSTLGEAHATLAAVTEAQGQNDRALTEWRSAARLMPDDAFAALGLGNFLAAQAPAAGSAPRAEALHALLTAVRAGAGDRTVLLSAATSLRRIGEAARAVEVLEPLRAAHADDGEVLGELAQALWVAGRRPEALTRMQQALAASPRNAGLHYAHALMAATQGDRAAATGALRQVLALEPAASPLRARAEQRLQQLGAPRR